MSKQNPFARVAVAGLSLAMSVAGCSGGSDNTPPPDMTVLPDLTLPDLNLGYPPGPYGAGIGDTMQNMTFHGYWAPTDTTGLASAKTYGTVDFDMVRTSGAKYALIELAAYW